ncbi:glycoside hydrolase family 78 protein [Hypoxylon sp. CO27-5]|nr:glycoside hydrolase family 78 protein [Hypoxylon sp. CO27-5]
MRDFSRPCYWLYVAALWQFVSSQGVNAQDNDTSWHQYVRAPPNNIVKPKAILSEYTSGEVTNPEGIVTGSGATTLSRLGDGTDIPNVVLDFGQNIVGLSELEFASSTNASDGFPGLRLYFSETLEFLTDRSDFTRSDNAGQGDGVAVRNEPFAWLNQWGCEFGSQVCSDGLHGFRYLKIELDALAEDAPYASPYGEIVINSVSLQWSGYLGTPDSYTGWFECSDPDLTQWWYDGAYTTEMCTDIFRDNDTEPRGASSPSLLGKWVILDGAKRDRDPYMGDLAVAALTSYLSHDIHEAARNVMEDLAQHQRDDGWIPPASIWDHVLYTGNVSYMESYYPTLVKVLDTYYTTHTDPATSLLVRQSGYGDYAFLPRDGSATYYSALYVLALSRAADLASFLSRSEDALRWRDRAANVSTAVLANLWDAEAGAFYDRKCSGTGCSAHAQDGNRLRFYNYAESALAYLENATARPYGHAFYDAAGEELGAGFSERVYAFISYFEIAARFESGLADSAIAQMRATYGHMAGADPGVTMWEGIGANGSKYEGAFTSLAHGWSTGLTPLLTTYVLGVRPLKHGFKEWTVRPLPSSDLTWAKGVVPTLYGQLSVQWERNQTDGHIVVNVVPPPGTNGTIVVPESQWRNNLSTQDDDGSHLEGRVIDGTVVFSVKGGRGYTIS